MVREFPDAHIHSAATSRRRAHRVTLQATLWLVWALVVASFAYLHAYTDIIGQRADDLLALGIHTLLFGVVGMIIVTRVEMWFDPEQFISSSSNRT